MEYARGRRKQSGIVIGLDRGSSSLKAVAVDGTGKLRGFLKAETETAGPDAIKDTVARLADEFALGRENVRAIALTGIGAKNTEPTIDGIPVVRVDEFTAIGRGALFLAGVSSALVASMGTGTAFVKAADGKAAVHLGGTGVGGGAIMGVCRYFYGLTRFPDIMTMAEKGDITRVDLTVGDIGSGDYDGLDPQLTSSNFGKITPEANREDVICGLVNMVLQTIGVMAVMTCKSGGMDTVVLVGALTIMPQVKPAFERFSRLSGLRCIVPENSTYAIAVGAALAGGDKPVNKSPTARSASSTVKPAKAAKTAPPTSAVSELVHAFESRNNPEQAAHLMQFFKTGPGQYGEGDAFLGIRMPETRALVKNFYGRLELDDFAELLDSPWHEIRLATLLLMGKTASAMAKKGDRDGVEAVRALYDAKLERANNWDLIDSSVREIMESFWTCRKTSVRDIRRQLAEWADSDNLWRERAAMIATYARLRMGSLRETFWLAERFIDHPHDLMHKASGWMLREAGKRDREALRAFLAKFHRRLPRTALRYAIEHLSPEERARWMAK